MVELAVMLLKLLIIPNYLSQEMKFLTTEQTFTKLDSRADFGR